MINVKKEGQWVAAGSTLKAMSDRAKRAPRTAQLRIALELERDIKQGIVNQAPGGVAFPPLAPMTLAVRKLRGFRGTKRLIVRGDLLKSIKTKEVDKGSAKAMGLKSYAVFVGVARSERGRGGKGMVNIAAIQEMGNRSPYVIKVTPKMRRFYMALFLAGLIKAPLKRNKRAILMYNRGTPFMAPAWNKWIRTAPERFEAIYRREMGL